MGASAAPGPDEGSDPSGRLAAVAAAMALLDDLVAQERPLAEHVATLDAVHQALAGALSVAER